MMDMETVLPIKSVSDIVKEIKEAELLPLAGEKQCDCGVCNCSSDI
jgi:hypothetical protein